MPFFQFKLSWIMQINQMKQFLPFKLEKKIVENHVSKFKMIIILK